MESVFSILKLEDLGVETRIAKTRLHKKLCELADRYLTQMNETALFKPNGKALAYTERARWLDDQVIKPAAKLERALSVDGIPYLSAFPLPLRELSCPYPQFHKIPEMLAELRLWCEEIKKRQSAEFDDGVEKPATSPFNDLKHALVYDLVQIFIETKSQEGKKLKFGPVNREVGIGKQETGGMTVEFVRLTAKVILGRPDPLTAQTRVATRKLKALIMTTPDAFS